MSENFIHFLSEEQCLININGENIGNIDNINNLELDIITKCNQIYVTYTPISTKPNIPFTFLLDTKNKVYCENKFIKVIPFTDNHYDINMTPFYYHQNEQSKILLNSSIGKFLISITCDNSTKITIFDNSSIVFSLNTTLLSSARAEIQKDILIVEGIIDKNNYYLLIIDTKSFEILHNDTSNSISKTTNNITSYKKLNNLSGHAQVFTFDYNNQKEIYYVYENNSPKKIMYPDLIPLAFMEAIKINDDNLAKSYLHNSHANTPIQKFRDYFNTFDASYLNRHYQNENKYNYTIESNNIYKNYNFLMEDNKIKDIEEIF